ncbi:non-structural maintenance of chromosomes element 4 homolog A [Condylostylus longicornis]|uniref:non-structural maintenance of chromosomes element 4 homolog A n=1 Tax=Condylostylus longicornis TaxID=2530218 RepID=UPI00244E431C|nr:non-structural maintenance of chromosomes element 4 homolog A [Condylostylus longicornis]
MSGETDSNRRKSRLKQLLDMGTDLKKHNDREDYEMIDKISEIIQETDTINRSVDLQKQNHDTTEVIMDAQIVQMSHELIGEVMQKIGASEFADEEWINAIMAIVYKNDNENWDKITEIAGSVCKMVKFSPSFLSDYDFKADSEEKVVKERQRKTKSNRGEEMRPENLSQIEKRDGNLENMNVIYRRILEIYSNNKSQPIPYYKLVIDPHNFMNTVHNAFRVAFLARDKSVKIWKEDDGFPYLQPLNKAEKSSASNDTIQAICTLNLNIVDEMIQKYKIKEALLKRD